MKLLRDILVESSPQTGREVVHHVSPFEIDGEFHPLSHFGTYKAARTVGSSLHYSGDKDEGYKDRPEYRKRYHYKVRLINHKNILHLDEDPAEHTPDYFLGALERHGLLSKEEKSIHMNHLQRFRDEKGYPYLKEMKDHVAQVMRDKGVDMLSYTNKYEHPGKKSYVITHPNQVKVLKKTPIMVRSSAVKKDKTRKPAARRTDIIFHNNA